MKKQIQVLELLIECMSMRAIARTLGVSPNTVNHILQDAGRASATYHDLHVRNVRAERVQCDENWSFIYAKEAHLETAKAPPPEAGDVWTWTAVDIDSKLMISYLVGDRGLQSARTFMRDLAGRLANKVELTTDAHVSYPAAVEEAFSGHVDYETTEMEGVSNSFVERQNLTMRMSMKRFARQTNAHSKKFEEPRPHGLALLPPLQLLPHPPDDPLHAGDGGRARQDASRRGVDRAARRRPLCHLTAPPGPDTIS